MAKHVSKESQRNLAELVIPGLGTEALLSMYGKIQTSDTHYDQCFGPETLLGPALYAETLADHYPSDVRPSIEVIDIGAGTGIVGQQLMKHNFRLIDAVEPSREMLEDAIGKNLYRRTYEIIITAERSSIPENSYDALITCGTFVENHLPVGSLHEFIRVVKPGGIIVLGIRENYLETVDAYRGKLEPLMAQLETSGQWKMLLRKVCPGIHMGDDGVIWRFQVTK